MLNGSRREFVTGTAQWALAGLIVVLERGRLAPATMPKKPFGSRAQHEPPLEPAEAPHLDPKQALKRNEQQIRDDVEKLYTLAEQLKKEVEKTDSTNVLSLVVVDSARQIENLAKQIKNLAVG
jgi:hypothetical protein